MANDKSVYTVTSVSKAFEILELLAEQPGGLHINALTAQLGMTRNKVYRLVSTLCESGLLVQEKTSGHYVLGFSSFALGQKLVQQSSVINHAHPIIENLARKHDEAVYMTVIRGDNVLFLDMADCDQQVKAVSLLGKQVPYFTNAAGKVMKALESAEIIDWLKGLKRGKYKSIEDTEKLACELQEIRANGGVAVDCDGLGEGIISIAVAVKDYAGHVIGAITMLGPSFRMLQERIENELIPSLVEAAAATSEKFGYAPC